MKPGKGSKYQNWYQTFRIRSFPYAGRPRLCRKRGRNITESPPFFQYENFLFGHHKTFSLSLWCGNAYHHVLYCWILVHLAFLNSAVRQLLASFRTFWCFIYVFVLGVFVFRAIEMMWRKPISSPDLPCQHFVGEGRTFVRVTARRRAWTGSERRGMIR